VAAKADHCPRTQSSTDRSRSSGSSWSTGPSTSAKRPIRIPGSFRGCEAERNRPASNSNTTSTAVVNPAGHTRICLPIQRDIAELLTIMDEGNCPCGHTADLIGRRIGQVDGEIHDLETLRANLVRLQWENEAARPLTLDAWSCQITSSQRGGDAT